MKSRMSVTQNENGLTFNQFLFACRAKMVADELYEEFESTKQLIIDLTRHLDGVESLYNKVNKEIKKRIEGK